MKPEPGKTNYWKRVSAVLALVVASGGALAVGAQYRPFAWRWDLITVAEVSYQARNVQITDWILQIRLALEKCKNDDSCPESYRLLLLEDQQRAQDERGRLATEQEKIK